ncbi:HTTM domain-containing protein [Bdellovibrio bacteriovorus]|uniref:HTTM domain-containing protein n=1 Tax=Bdellovibrio bacteriovorus TaxID=959 RepID=UPI0021CF1858|nr:HTTM domain-containing protein [Bdellovibrio bacteriovorus]UXR66020.1 HTTM domain-containing protein [Bdellovibrio bacteriovorus]
MKSLLKELHAQSSLGLIGVILSVEHVFTFIFWLTERPIHLILSSSTPAVCWPLLSFCESLKPSSALLTFMMGLYLALAIGAILSWVLKRYKTGIFLLWVLLLFKTTLILFDYRLTGNYHYIPTLLTFAFLLVPGRARAMPMTFFVLYFTAGILKLNSQWLSGAAINDRLIPAFFTRMGVWYVLLLELVFIFLLFARKDRWFYFLFAQLVIFHLYSWHLTRFFYPCVMLLLLGILLVTRPLQKSEGLIFSWYQCLRQRSAVVLLVLFVALQLPQYYIPGEAAITGEGRMYALIMYDGRTQCQPHVSIWKKNQDKEDMPLVPPWLLTRTACDPLIFMRLTEKVCSWVEKDPNILQVDLNVPIRYQQQEEWKSLVSITDFCRKHLTYSSFFPNSWINKLELSSDSEQ